jgi:hypothetical protein
MESGNNLFDKFINESPFKHYLPQQDKQKINKNSIPIFSNSFSLVKNHSNLKNNNATPIYAKPNIQEDQEVASSVYQSISANFNVKTGFEKLSSVPFCVEGPNPNEGKKEDVTTSTVKEEPVWLRIWKKNCQREIERKRVRLQKKAFKNSKGNKSKTNNNLSFCNLKTKENKIKQNPDKKLKPNRSWNIFSRQEQKKPVVNVSIKKNKESKSVSVFCKKGSTTFLPLSKKNPIAKSKKIEKSEEINQIKKTEQSETIKQTGKKKIKKSLH